MKFEEVLPALRKGYKIRDKEWPKDEYIYIKDKFLYDQQCCLVHLSSFGLLAGDWEVIEEPEPDWSYIIKNKCLCRFWDSVSEEVLSCKFRYLKVVDSRKTYPYKDESGCAWKNCRPVRRDEINFYEDRKDN